jgi:hypothetical protein
MMLDLEVIAVALIVLVMAGLIAVAVTHYLTLPPSGGHAARKLARPDVTISAEAHAKLSRATLARVRAEASLPPDIWRGSDTYGGPGEPGEPLPPLPDMMPATVLLPGLGHGGTRTPRPSDDTIRYLADAGVTQDVGPQPGSSPDESTAGPAVSRQCDGGAGSTPAPAAVLPDWREQTLTALDPDTLAARAVPLPPALASAGEDPVIWTADRDADWAGLDATFAESMQPGPEPFEDDEHFIASVGSALPLGALAVPDPDARVLEDVAAAELAAYALEFAATTGRPALHDPAWTTHRPWLLLEESAELVAA